MPCIFFLLLFVGLGELLPVASLADEQFIFYGFKNTNLSLDGMATVTPDGLLMLTNGTKDLTSHAFYPAPLQLHKATNSTDMESFSTAFVIGITCEGLQESSTPGMAFFVAKSKNFTSAMWGSFMGLPDNFFGNATKHLFAVVLEPVTKRDYTDMTSDVVWIIVNGLVDSIRTQKAGYYDDATGAFRNLSLGNREAMQVWVDFDGQSMQVNVTMAPLQVPRPKKPLLSTTINLSSIIEDTAHVGFSSATDSLSNRNRQYVLGWSFKMNSDAPELSISSLPSLPVTSPKLRSKMQEIVLPIASAVLFLTVAAVAVLFLRRRRMYAELKEDWEAPFGPYRFSYKDLFHATNGFSDKQLLGTGGFGRVYHGVLASKTEVAVKKVAHRSRQGMQEFVAEVVSIGRLRHRNLVQLLGYCRRKGELLLVYDYMPNVSLDKYLYDQNKVALSWGQRFRIIKGIASVLVYLHECWELVVVHRDIKASNVLLDGDMNGRLGDFGLARLYDHGVDPQRTRVAGTIGYLAPELLRTGKPTPVTDVFAFGVFLLEVACGRRPLGCITSKSDGDQQNVLLDWVQEHQHKGTALATVDARLSGNYDVDEARMVIKLGLMCAHPLPDARPTMRQVVQYLEGDAPMPEVAPTYLSYTMMTLMQNEEFPIPFTVTSMSGLSGGR